MAFRTSAIQVLMRQYSLRFPPIKSKLHLLWLHIMYDLYTISGISTGGRGVGGRNVYKISDDVPPYWALVRRQYQYFG